MSRLRIQSQLRESQNWFGVWRGILTSSHTRASQLYYFLVKLSGWFLEWISSLPKGSLAHSLLHISDCLLVFDVERSRLFLRAPNFTAFINNELKCSAQQQAQTNSKSISSSAHKIKKLKPTCIETDQARSKSSRSSAQQINEVTCTEKSTHIKWKRSSAQHTEEVKRTANGRVKRTAHQRCQARSKSIISSVHQIKRLRPRKTQ